MGSAALTAVAWVFSGVVIGAILGWVVVARKLKAERQRNEEQLHLTREEGDTRVAALTRDLDRAKTRLSKFETTEPALKVQVTEHARALQRIQAQILDRESTITSLRTRLYGSRTAAALIEEELEAREGEVADLRRQLASTDEGNPPERAQEPATTDPTDNLTVDLGSGLSIETGTQESHSVEQR